MVLISPTPPLPGTGAPDSYNFAEKPVTAIGSTISVTPAPGTTLIEEDGYNLVGNGAGLDMGVASLSFGSASASGGANLSSGGASASGACNPVEQQQAEETGGGRAQ